MLPAGRWPKNLVIGYAGGYTYEVGIPCYYLRDLLWHCHLLVSKPAGESSVVTRHRSGMQLNVVLYAVAEAIDHWLFGECQGRHSGPSDPKCAHPQSSCAVHEQVHATAKYMMSTLLAHCNLLLASNPKQQVTVA